MNNRYEELEIEVIIYDNEDIITSSPFGEANEPPFIDPS